MKTFLWPFSPFCRYKLVSCQLLAKVCALSPAGLGGLSLPKNSASRLTVTILTGLKTAKPDTRQMPNSILAGYRGIRQPTFLPVHIGGSLWQEGKDIFKIMAGRPHATKIQYCFFNYFEYWNQNSLSLSLSSLLTDKLLVLSANAIWWFSKCDS